MVLSVFVTKPFTAPHECDPTTPQQQIGITTFVSTQPAFMQALCASGKMADLASKTQAQHMVMDTLALAVCSGANYALRHDEGASWG